MVIAPESIPSMTEAPLVSAPNLQYRQDLSKLRPNGGNQPLFRVYDLSGLAVGVTRTVGTEGNVPDYWYVLCSYGVTGANTSELALWNGPAASGDPMRINAGRFLKITATSEFFTVMNVRGDADITVIAGREFCIEIS